MDVTRSGSQTSHEQPAEWFTGTVRIDPNPPKQFYAGSYAVAGIRSALEARLQEIKAHEALSKSTDGTFV